MRINARLDDSHSQKLEFLIRVTSLGISDVLKRAIDVYYDQVYATRPQAAEILGRSGFIGCAEAEPDLSERYKEDLQELLAAKHDHR